mgnify:CR=1 FL=1
MPVLLWATVDRERDALTCSVALQPLVYSACFDSVVVMHSGSLGIRDNIFPTIQWAFVRRRFLAIQNSIALRPDELSDGAVKLEGVVRSLNRSYRDESVFDHFLLAGSWGKNTAIRPPSDLDVLFMPPTDVFHQFNSRVGNRQSQLLQHVREALMVTYPQTRIRGDGQVVVVDFNSITVEVVPAFSAQGGGYLICDTNDGGRWKRVQPHEEFGLLQRSDEAFHGNVRKLTHILKQWKNHCNVPIKAFHLEQLVRETLAAYDYGGRDEFWFDWLVRDIFSHVYGRAGGGFFMPGNTNEWIELGSEWQTKAWSAYEWASKACVLERQNLNVAAGVE